MTDPIKPTIEIIEENYVKFFVVRNDITSPASPDNLNDPNNLAGNPSHQKVLSDVQKEPRIKAILAELADWPCYEIKSHKDVGHPLHKLSFIAELGFTKEDPGVRVILDKVLQNQSNEGPFQLLINIPKNFGGSGEPLMSWVMSDAPLLLYSVVKLNNCEITGQVRKGIDHIASIVSENGWHCIAAKELGGFRGPGRKDDPCPYATLMSMKMLSLTNKNEYIKEKEIGINTIFELWDRRKEIRPYLFGMGTDFRKLKLPFVWYDILNVVDTLSCYTIAVNDNRFKEMFSIIKEKETMGGYIPESVYLKAKEWDFGQKKKPSEFMNAVVSRIEKRIERNKTNNSN